MGLNNIKINNTTNVKTGVVYDISKATGQSYETLADALGTDGRNVPSEVREGGMSVRFVHTGDDKYMQYRLMSDTFNTTVNNWQGVDDELTAQSDNLVKSGGVYRKLYGNVVKDAGINTLGTLITLTNYYVTDYILYIQGNDVTWNFGVAPQNVSDAQLCAYASDKTTRIAGFNSTGDGGRVIPASSLIGCVYIRATFHKSRLNSVVVSFGDYSFVPVVGNIVALDNDVTELKQRINVTKCTNSFSSVSEGEYFYYISVNSFALRTTSGFKRISVPFGLIYYNGQIASFDGEKYVVNTSPTDELSKIDINNLHYTNNQVNATNGELSIVNRARLCSELVISKGLDITIQEGYYMYFYMYDMNGNYIGYNESNNAGRFILSFPFNCKLRLVFMHSDKTTNISSIDRVISSYTGLYNYDITSNKIIDGSITLHKIDRSPNTFDDTPTSGSEKLINSSAVYFALNYDTMEMTKSGIFVVEDLNAKIPICNVMRGNNVFNYSSVVTNKIRNDSGAEIYDQTSSYFSQLIPAFGGVYLNSSVQIQRVYFLGINGEWIVRTFVENTKFIVPSEYSGQTVYYIQLQFRIANISSNNVVTLGKFGYKEIGEGNIQFATNPNGLLYDNTSNIIWKNDFDEIDYYAFIPKEK